MIKHRYMTRAVLAAVLVLIGNACAYRFTNNFVRNPAGAKTIAIESVFDTSREVLPHEVLWESLQRAFAKDGHLRLASRSEADLLLRVHLSNGNISPVGVVDEVPAILEDPQQVAPPDLPDVNKFRELTKARTFSQDEVVSGRMEVEVLDLRNKNVVMRKIYNTGSGFKSLRDGNFATNASYLYYEQSVTSAFKRMADDVSARVLTDLLVQ